MNEMRPWTVRLFVFSLALGGLRDPRLFALGGAAAWWAVWKQRPALGPAAAWLPWLGWAALSTAFSPEPLAGLPVLARWSAVLGCASLAAGWNEVDRKNWLKAFLITATAAALTAIATGAGKGWRGEMTGLIPPNYNYTAFVLSAAAVAAAAWLIHPRGPRGGEAAAPFAACALFLACLVLARSRGACLGLGAAVVLLAARRWGGATWAAAAIAAIAIGAALAAGALPASVEALLFKTYRPHAEARPRIWKAAAAIASDAPLLGVGPGRFAAGFRLRPVPLEDGAAHWSMSTDYAHSELLQAAAETGWMGLALWLLGAAASIAALFGRWDEDPIREAAAAAAAAMTAQLAVDNMLQVPALAALWLCALTAAARPAERRGREWSGAAIAAGAALAATSWVPKALADASPALAAAVYPARPGPREDLAYAALAAGRLDAAYAHWATAERLEPFSAIHPWRRAQIAASAGDWPRAEALASRAIGLEPGFLSARVLRAEALARAGRARDAREELDMVIKLRSSRGDVSRGSGYERTVWNFEPMQFERAAALAGRESRR